MYLGDVTKMDHIFLKTAHNSCVHYFLMQWKIFMFFHLFPYEGIFKVS